MANRQGKLLVIEGLEGAGKSTAMNTVSDFLYAKGLPFITVREPGGTAVGELLRTCLKNPEYRDVLDDRSELLLMYTSRIQLVEQVIKPALAKGTWVLADRFELSSFAYQGGGRGLDFKFIQALSEFALQGFKPDLTLYLDVAPDLGLKRAGARGAFDRIEQESVAFFHRVHEGYMNAIKTQAEVLLVDASLPLEEVQHTLQSILAHYIEQNR
jgi:dTMP kinase